MAGSERKVHPAAAVFPMLPDDELAELAEDIKANGLLHPIVLDAEGTLIDGRNRLAACRLAGVSPSFTTLNGHDPLKYILSANARRRHMSKGALAMATVEAVMETITTLGRAEMSDLAAVIGVGRDRIGVAAYVHRHGHPLCLQVIVGALGLDAAKTEAKPLEDAETTRARAAEDAARKMARVQASDQKLADAVQDGTVSLDVAIAEIDKREQEERERRERDTAGFARTTSYLAALLGQDPARISRDWLPQANTYAGIAGCETLWTAEGLRDLARRLGEAADAWGE